MKNKDLINQLLEKARTKKFQEEQSKGLIQAIGEEIKGNLTPKNIEDIAVNMGNEIKDALVKSIGGLNLNDHVSKAVEGITITTPEVKIPDVHVTVPEIKIPTINVPEPKVTVNIPDFPKIPDFPHIEMPSTMEVFGSVDLNYDYKSPLPVRLVTLDGKPYEAIGGISGGASNSRVTVSDILTSSGSSVIDNDGFLKVTGNFAVTAAGASSVALVNSDGTYYNSDNPLPVTGTFSTTPGLQVSGAVDSVNVVDAFGSTAVSGVFNADNRIRVSVETGGSGLTDAELRASSLDVRQTSGAVSSVIVNEIFGSTGANVVNPDGRLKVELPSGSSGLTDTELRAAHLDVQQVSGAVDSVNITNASIAVTGTFFQATQPVSATDLDIRDLDFATDDVSVYQVSGHRWSTEATQSGTWNIGTVTTVTAVTDVTNSLKAALVDSSGVQYSGSNPVPVTGPLTDTQLRASTLDVKQVSGSIDSVSVTNTVTITGAVTATGGGYLTDTQLRASTLDVKQVSGSVDSVIVNSGTLTGITNSIETKQVSGTVDSVSVVSITDIFSTTAASSVVNPDNRVKVELPSGSSGLTDTELRATSLTINQLSGASFSVFSSVDTTQSLYNADNRLRVSVETGGSGLTDSELRATSVPVSQVSGAVDSVSVIGNIQGITNGVNILSTDPANVSVSSYQVSGASWSTSVVSISDIFSTTAASSVVNPDNRVKVELPSGSSGLTDTELRATSLTVQQLSGAAFSVSVNDIFGSTGTGFYNLDNRLRVEVPSYTQAISVTDIFATSATSNVVTPDNRVKVDGSGVTQPVSGTVAVSSLSGTTAANIVDSTGVAYSGSNPIPTYLVAGSGNSTISVGPTLHDAVDDGAAPQKIGGTAVQANPTPVAGGDIVRATFDDLGRQLTKPLQVRDLIMTAYVSVTNGTETTLIAASAGSYLDCIMLTGSNNSDASVSVDIRCTTAGNIVHTMRIPANSTAGWAPSVPWPQDSTGNNWTVDGPDETGRTLTFSALFSKEV